MVGGVDGAALTHPRWTRSLRLLAFVSGLAWLLSAQATPCAGQDTLVSVDPIVWPRPPISIFVLTPSEGQEPGTVAHIYATARDLNGRTLHVPIQWHSSHPEVVTVRRTSDSTADLVFRRKGRAMLTVTAAGTSTWAILYGGPIPSAARLHILPDAATIQPGDLILLQAQAYDSLSRLKPALWTRWSWTDSTRIRFFGVPREGEIILRAVKPGCVRVLASLERTTASTMLGISTPCASLQPDRPAPPGGPAPAPR